MIATQNLTPAQTAALRGLLSAKELRLFDYLAGGGDPNIGEICKACHTTPWTLLKKTHPGLQAKLAGVIAEIPA